MRLAALLALAAATLVAKVLRRTAARLEPGPWPAGPDDKVLIVRGWTEQELAGILGAFADLYGGRLGPAFRTDTIASEGTLRVTFPAGIAPTMLALLVNYVRYPKDFDLRTRDIVAVGRLTLTADFDLPDRALVGQKAIIYVPKDDGEYDLVYVRTEAGATFESSFASRRWKAVPDARLPAGVERPG